MGGLAFRTAPITESGAIVTPDHETITTICDGPVTETGNRTLKPRYPPHGNRND